MAVVLVGIQSQGTPTEVLERVAIGGEELPKALSALAELPAVDEVVVLSTCLRTELYAVVGEFHPSVAMFREFLATWAGLPPEDVADHLYTYWGPSAARHLFRVAAGLESAVLGEGEVLGQVRGAWERATAEGVSGPVADRLFRHAVTAGKRARAETGIARGTTSLPAAAVTLAGEALGGLARRRAVVVGAGEMGRAAARALAGAGAAVTVLNRTPERAAALAAEVGGRAGSLTDLDRALPALDIVVTAMASAPDAFDAARLAGPPEQRAGRPLAIVDLARPRNVAPAGALPPGVVLYALDDLARLVKAGREARHGEVAAVESLLEEELSRYLSHAAAREVAPTISALHRLGEELRLAELARFRSRLGELDEGQEAALDGLTRALVAKLLHGPTAALRAAAGTERGRVLSDSLSSLFEL